MKIAIIGCGAMGSVYAGLLAGAGNEILALTRSQAHVEAINEHGLRVEGPLGDRRTRMKAYTAPPAEHVDLVVIAVKAVDVESAARLSLPLIGPRTIVLTIQNGLGSADVVAELLGADRLAVGIASGFGASLRGPGHAHHNAMKAMRFGAFAGLDIGRIAAVAEVWRAAGFDAEAVADIKAMQWEKLICNVAYSAPCALAGMTVGEVMDDPDMGVVSRAAATEAWRVALALGIDIRVSDPVELVREFGGRMPNAKPSALLDHEACRPSEINVINGAVPRAARHVGVATPVNDTLVSLVAAKERRWRN